MTHLEIENKTHVAKNTAEMTVIKDSVPCVDTWCRRLPRADTLYVDLKIVLKMKVKLTFLCSEPDIHPELLLLAQEPR